MEHPGLLGGPRDRARRDPEQFEEVGYNPQKPAYSCYNTQMLTAERRQAILARVERDGRVVAS